MGFGVAAGLAFHDLQQIRASVLAARDLLQHTADDPLALSTPEGRATTEARIDTALQSIASARHRASNSLVLSVAGVIPGLSTQQRGINKLVDDAGEAAAIGRELLSKVDVLAARNQIHDGSVPVEGMRLLDEAVRAAAGRLQILVRSSAGLWGPVGDARHKLDRLATETSSRLNGAADALDVALPFSGASGDRTYLVAVQNNAEMRDQGAVLSYVTIHFTGSKLSFGDKGSVGKLLLDHPAPTPLPPGTDAVFGSAQPTRLWHVVNATADFPFSAQAMVDMFRQATGQSVDGVIAIDVPGLAEILRVIGPVEVPQMPEPVTAENAGRLLLHDLYTGLPPESDQSGRRERLGDVTEAVVHRLTTGDRDAVALGRGLAGAAKGGHLRLWSTSADEEKVFERTGLGGPPGAIAGDRTFHLAVENRVGSKLDYFVKPKVHMEVFLTDRGTATVHTTVTIDNQAPVGAAPSYQLGPDLYSKNPGDYLAWVLLWAPEGSTQPGGTPEAGLNLVHHVVGVGAGEQRTLEFDTAIPNAVRDGRLTLRLVPQPRLEPVDLQVDLRAPDWSVDGDKRFHGPWDQVRTLSWDVGK